MSPPGLRLEVGAEFGRMPLHFVDVQHLEDISRDESLSADEREIICSVRELVGYGINGGKRVYVGYADERKAAQRKVKEAVRGKHFYAREFENSNTELPRGYSDRVLCGGSLKKAGRREDADISGDNFKKWAYAK